MPQEYMRNVVKELLQIFQALLEEFPFGESVQGYFEYQHNEFEEKSPLNIETLLCSQFSRTFNPALITTLEELREEAELDKQKLHLALLEKYLNIKLPCTMPYQPSELCSAYFSVPSDENSDEFLHTFFLQPYKLFNISHESRKFNENIKDKRVWYWQDKACDAAPFFRTLIQIYILSSILQDYENTDNAFENEIVLENLEALKILRTEMLKSIQNSLRSLFLSIEQVKNPNKIKGNSSGVFSDENQAIEELLPGFTQTASVYPFGRLLFGQTPFVRQHVLALEASYDKDPTVSQLKYTFVFVLKHLNLSSSSFWLKTILQRTFKHWLAFKNYLLGETENDRELIYQAIRSITTILIVISSPLLILLPGLYGLTSLPFTALRSVCIHGPFSRLKHYNLLLGLDLIEATKDFFLFTSIALPIFSAMLASFNLLIPPLMLGIGGTASYLLLIFLERSMTGRSAFSYLDPNPLYSLAMSPPFSLIGTSVIFGTGSYLGCAYLGRTLNYLTPSIFKKPLSNLLSPIKRVITRAENYLRNWLFKPSITDEMVIPENTQKPNLPLPKISLYQPTSEMLSKINTYEKKLGQLNQALYLEKEQKVPFRTCLLSLNIDNNTTEASLALAMQQANTCLEDCLSAEEIVQTSKIMAYFKAQDNNFIHQFQTERIFMLQHENQDVYQPSWKLLKLLQDQKFIYGMAWTGPDEIRPSAALLNKYQRLLALAPFNKEIATIASYASVITPLAEQRATETNACSLAEENLATLSYKL